MAVVYLFLQGWRATLIPLLAVPVSLIGAFVFFPVFGFSINTLSLFGLVLAIGLVVDDAIVVVEAVERHIENGVAPKEAALRAMEEISGPVIGIALVLSAVFVPTAFIPGITGRLYQQFAVTIAISVILSAFNALSLSPALASVLLKPRARSKGLLAKFFGWFNGAFTRATDGYVRVSGALLHKSVLALTLLVAFGVAGVWIGGKLPGSFVPDEDQGYFYLNVQLPNAASLQRTEEVMAKVQQIAATIPGVEQVTTVSGFSLLSFARTSYSGFGFISMKEWDSRKTRAEQFQEIKARLNAELSKLPEAVAFGFSPPAIPGVGTSGGFTFMLEDRSGGDVKFLSDNVNQFMAAARKRPEIASLTTTFLPSVPQQFVTVDRDKVIKQGVAINDVYRTIQAFMGGLFINYFNRFGRQWQVYIEAEGDYRTRPENVGQFYVRNGNDELVPLSALTRFKSGNGPEFTLRFNEYRSAQLNGSAAPGYSSNQAMKALEETFAQTMPAEMGYDYSGISFQEKRAQEGVSSGVIFGFSLLFVFLILAALYESWTLPFSVLLSTPVAVFGAFGVLLAAPYSAGPHSAALHGADRKRCVLANRPGHADRPGRQERHPDRGVRKGRIRQRTAARRSCDGGCAAALAAHSDDIVRIHPGLRAVVDRHRGRSRRAANHGHHRDRWDGRGQRHRPLPGARHFLRGREGLRGAPNARPRCVRPSPCPVKETDHASANSPDRDCGPRNRVRRRPQLQTSCDRCSLGVSSAGAAVSRPSRFYRRSPVVRSLQGRKAARADSRGPRAELRSARCRTRAWKRRAPIWESLARINFQPSGPAAALRSTASRATAKLPCRQQFLPSQNRNFGTAALQLLSFEIDIWGKLRRSTEAARANLLSAEETRKAVVTTLVSDVATAYLTLLELDYTLDISRRTLENREASLALTRSRQTGGVSTLLDLRQSEQLVFTASQTIPGIQQQIEQTENQIRLLLGEGPGPRPAWAQIRRAGVSSRSSRRPAIYLAGAPPRYPRGRR